MKLAGNWNFPRPSVYNAPNVALVHFKRSGYLSCLETLCVSVAHQSDRGVRYGVASAPALPVPVSCVVLAGSKKQVRGVDTRPVVTAMADAHTVRYFPAIDNPRRAVGWNRNASHAAKRDVAVAISVEGCSPNPTGLALGNTRPKPFLESIFEPRRKRRVLQQFFRHGKQFHTSNGKSINLCH